MFPAPPSSYDCAMVDLTVIKGSGATGAGRLLASDEPAPFKRVPGRSGLPLLLVCDHASNYIPKALGNLGLPQETLAQHVAWDIGSEALTRRLAALTGAPAVLSHFSRLVVDPNRSPDDPTLMPQISDGFIIPGNRGLDKAARKMRIESLFEPYHKAIEESLQDMMAGDSQGRPAPEPVMVSIHSFTPVFKGHIRPWPIGILWNRDGRLPVPLMEALRSEGYQVGDNEPYSGRNDHGHTIHNHAERHGLAHVLIEVRQDLITTTAGVSNWADILAQGLKQALLSAGMSWAAQLTVPGGNANTNERREG